MPQRTKLPQQTCIVSVTVLFSFRYQRTLELRFSVMELTGAEGFLNMVFSVRQTDLMIGGIIIRENEMDLHDNNVTVTLAVEARADLQVLDAM